MIRISGRVLPSGRLILPAPQPDFATISYVGSVVSANAQYTNVSTVCQPGDVAFAIVSGEISIGLAAGWTSVFSIHIASQFSQRFAYRVCTGTTVNLGSWQYGQLAYLAVYRGVDNASPIGLQGGGHSIGNFIYPALTPFSPNSWALATASNRAGSVNPLNNNTLNNGVITRQNNYAAFPPNLFYGDTNGSREFWSSASVASTSVCLARVYEIKAAPNI